MVNYESIADVLAAPYHRVFRHELEGGYTASILELDGVSGVGPTIALANETLEMAWVLWLADEREAGRTIPVPMTAEELGSRITLRNSQAAADILAAALRAQMEDTATLDRSSPAVG